MVDSRTVLWGQTLVYTAYALVIIAVVAWFAYKLTRGDAPTLVPPKLFYGFVAFLVVTGVSLHLITYNTIPWSPQDLHRGQIQADQVFEISVANHVFELPSAQLTVECNQEVLFDVSSADLTYGFGLFRADSSMLFQMQVISGHHNDLLWTFEKNGVYTIRSTEYSGPEGVDMTVPDAVQVVGCTTQDEHAPGEGATS